MVKTASFNEFLKLFWISLVVKKRNFIEFCKVVWKYYPNFQFLKTDLYLLLQYLWKSPFKISKEFLMNQNETDLYAYGETPLTTLDRIAKECGITESDIIYELGAGRGRGCFWLHYFIKCKVIGLEIIPEFVKIANKIKVNRNLKNVEFLEENILNHDFRGATAIYLYGTCYEDSFIQELVHKFKKLPIGTKIITISYSLEDYDAGKSFEIIKCFPASFTWGQGDVYLQTVC